MLSVAVHQPVSGSPQSSRSDPAKTIEMDDPSQDGWDTEAFHLQAKNQLKKLGQVITSGAASGKIDPKPLRSLCESESFCFPLTAQQFARVYDHNGLIVEELETMPVAEPTPIWKELDRLISGFEKQPQLRVEFKVFKVETSSGNPVTRQYVSIFGSTDDGLAEYFGEWNIAWAQSDPQQKPRIKKIDLVSLKRSSFVGSQQPIMRDMTEQVMGENSAFHLQHRFGLNHWASTIETDLNRDLMGHQGIAVGDVDGDLLDDVYICQTGGIPNRLYRNDGTGKVVDISGNSGVNFLDHTTSALFSDLDNDGDQDLIVGMFHGTAILANDGQGRFEQKLFLTDAKHIYSPTAVDFDVDGDLDIYLCVYYSDGSSVQEFPFPYPFNDASNGGRNIFLRNEGGFKFADVTQEVGLDENNSRFSYSAGWDDFDGDGDQDLYVANDFGKNNLYVNDRGQFRDLTDQFDAEDGNFGMSVSWGDFNMDGWPDIYISNMFSGAGNRIVPQAAFNPDLNESAKQNYLKLARGNTLLQNLGGNQFRDVTLESGVHLGRWAWGSAFADMNNDGWEDILVGNGYITGQDSGDL